jgi:hypothetical protein
MFLRGYYAVECVLGSAMDRLMETLYDAGVL